MASLENCPTCGNATSENASVCPACGEPLEKGWADIIRNERHLAEEEEIRLEEERLERLHWEKQLEVDRAKKAKFRKWKIGLSFIVGIYLLIMVPTWYENYTMEQLKENDPEENERVMNEIQAKKEAETKAAIEKLEAEVATVPTTDHDRNLTLYRRLKLLDPDSTRYAEKITFYEARRNESIAAEEQAERELERREREAEVFAEAERKRKGFHCLSGWDGSHRGVKQTIEDRMRDPDSFEHIETRITPVNESGTHTLSMQYRARNGFGGMTNGIATATIQNSSCDYSITSIE